MHVDPFVIEFPLGYGSLAMKNDYGLERYAAISHDVKDNNSLPFIPAATLGFTGHRFHPCEII
jgi:hypothetical protein